MKVQSGNSQSQLQKLLAIRKAKQQRLRAVAAKRQQLAAQHARRAAVAQNRPVIQTRDAFQTSSTSAPMTLAPPPPSDGKGPEQSLLARGSNGGEVAQLQNLLNQFGAGLDVDGDFGPMTEAAVRNFQASHGLDVDGIVGPQTWGALMGGAPAAAPVAQPAPSGGGEPLLSQGANGPAVAELQQLLAAAGCDPGPADGDFGPHTAAAVRMFQASRGLDVDGVVGPQTWGALRGGTPASTPVQPGPAPSSGAGSTLSQGAKGPEVAELQQLLLAAGCNPGAVDGDFGPATASAVRFFQATRGLSVDGVVGPQTWGALRANAPAVISPPSVGGDVRDRILAIARGEIGTVEATNNNDGDVAKYPNFFGRPAQSWCANFVSWVYTHAGIDLNDPWCPSVLNKLVAEGKWKGRNDPQPGDLVLFDWDQDGVADHVGIVERDNGDGSITTIEGNTGNPSTGQEGVWERTRWINGTVMGFGNP